MVNIEYLKEYKTRPCGLEKEDGFTYYHLPVTGGGDVPESPEAVAGIYLNMMDDQMNRIVDTIMSAAGNVMYFCNAGKDRTGEF
ncbi:Tyrosine phosphatase family protein [Eubacterium ruminantium]|nr:Tyrosine phosphatase family protein [Eubacterium ruminantium]